MEKPSWFTDHWAEHVPNEYIPYDSRVKYMKTKVRVEGRRKSMSVRELLGGEEDK